MIDSSGFDKNYRDLLLRNAFAHEVCCDRLNDVLIKLRRLSSLPVHAFHPVLSDLCSLFGVKCVLEVRDSIRNPWSTAPELQWNFIKPALVLDVTVVTTFEPCRCMWTWLN